MRLASRGASAHANKKRAARFRGARSRSAAHPLLRTKNMASWPDDGTPALRVNPSPNLFLIGPMGAGKTTLGKRLAAHFALPFVDLDAEIETHTGAGVALIFDIEGEPGFRRRESGLLDGMQRARRRGARDRRRRGAASAQPRAAQGARFRGLVADRCRTAIAATGARSSAPAAAGERPPRTPARDGAGARSAVSRNRRPGRAGADARACARERTGLRADRAALATRATDAHAHDRAAADRGRTRRTPLSDADRRGTAFQWRRLPRGHGRCDPRPPRADRQRRERRATLCGGGAVSAPARPSAAANRRARPARGRSAQESRRRRESVRCVGATWRHPRRLRDRAGRRRGRRHRRLRGGVLDARHRFRASTDHAAGDGGCLGRRQDRRGSRRRQEPDRRVPPAARGDRRRRRRWRRLPRPRIASPASRKSIKTACHRRRGFLRVAGNACRRAAGARCAGAGACRSPPAADSRPAWWNATNAKPASARC